MTTIDQLEADARALAIRARCTIEEARYGMLLSYRLLAEALATKSLRADFQDAFDHGAERSSIPTGDYE